MEGGGSPSTTSGSSDQRSKGLQSVQASHHFIFCLRRRGAWRRDFGFLCLFVWGFLVRPGTVGGLCLQKRLWESHIRYINTCTMCVCGGVERDTTVICDSNLTKGTLHNTMNAHIYSLYTYYAVGWPSLPSQSLLGCHMHDIT